MIDIHNRTNEAEALHDHAHVKFLPPIAYFLGLGGAFVIQFLFELPILEDMGLSGTIGLVVFFLGLFLIGWSVNIFKRYDEELNPGIPTNVLIMGGPYFFSRNPMYLSFTVMYIGLGLVINSWWAFIFLPFVIGAIHYGVILPEERYLTRKFGEKYLAYKSHVRRWI